MAAASGGAGAACAACKYQRRRCTPDCPLAEFFPHDRPRVFRNAHRLFGVSNILKTLDRAGPEKRREAMHCIIYESQAWDIYPASGCVPIIHDLQQRIRQAELDLRRVYAAIQAYRAAAAAQGGGPVPDSDGDPLASASAPPPPFQLQPATGDDDVAAEAYGGGGGWPSITMYGGDQQQMVMNAAAYDDVRQHYDMTTTSAAAVANMAGKLVPQQDHRFLVDATVVSQPEHQQQLTIQPAELDDEMSYFVNDGVDGDSEMPPESSMDSSEKKATRAPKMESANSF
ncbi:LOB domain-containing protein 4-like [Panicum virgatum]|uniref:LOB domain-containing protein 4-like n=1 Tax=Panicum virgatum TaxID=38727 RepID=UPI0019D66090|nr:LOB domain-containing protein 4-like [Panicum virgatum]